MKWDPKPSGEIDLGGEEGTGCNGRAEAEVQ